MSYTKGKWFNNGGRIYAQQGDNIREICDVGLINHQSQVDMANARLIAAAPALLEACEKASEALRRFRTLYSGTKFNRSVWESGDTNFPQLLKDIEAAIDAYKKT